MTAHSGVTISEKKIKNLQIFYLNGKKYISAALANLSTCVHWYAACNTEYCKEACDYFAKIASTNYDLRESSSGGIFIMIALVMSIFRA